MGLKEPPPPHIASNDSWQGLVELWKPFAAETEDGGAANDDGEEGWIAEDARLFGESERIALPWAGPLGLGRHHLTLEFELDGRTSRCA